ncbi:MULTISPECIES: WXG100 family type VII secretion target [Streptomycetaceae]|uniref:ESAT-6-like protein n=1 Tax=Streptantibioticus parmotrematis TaxID=2873249 RepID=A0ABS7R2T6_9ACTN|nr:MULTISPECIES: WXG100 family type VII secretion target [Streptomycetaceae]MBY8889189.1 WXG100 family type VII secretion target [Streptantibioticus parmotrematis]PWI43622.1 WXG100 family type VII secretion target [Streptomyces sp. ICBB 8177]
MSTGDDLKVHYSSLTDAATALRTAAKDLGNQLEQLRRRVQRVSETWEGDAQQSFKQADAIWQSRAADIQSVLDDVARRVEDAHGSYQATDRKASQYFHA